MKPTADKDDRVLEANALAIKFAAAIDGKRTTYRIKTKQKDPSTRQWVWTIERGLELQVSPTGTGTYYFVYAKGPRDARQVKRVVLGHRDSIDPSEACDKAAKMRAAILDGDPHADARAKKAEERRAAYTFENLSDAWLREHARPNLEAKTVQDYGRMLKKDIKPAIGATAADKVTKADIVRLVTGVAGRAGYRANRVLALVRSIYRWGLSKDLIAVDPTLGVRRERKEEARDRDLSWLEIRTFWRSLDGAMSKQIALAIRLSLATGQRIGKETTQAEKAEFVLEGLAPTWEIPKFRTKNDEPHRVPLSPLAVRLVKEAIELSGDSVYLFPSAATDPTDDDKPIDPHAPTRAMSRARGDDERTTPLKPAKRKGTYKRGPYNTKPREPKAGLGVRNVRIHDLRRTVASRMAELGISESVISRVLNHVSAFKGTITGRVYNKHGYDREKRQALELWGSRLEACIEGRVPAGADVLQFPAAAPVGA